jgi:catechol 2,3-dioxygenase-like lactoylglutathione lyase family enzyme
MKINLTSIFVRDQAHALRFYTEVLGFIKKREIPLGAYKWLTVVSPEGPGEIELLLEPNNNPVAKTFQEALVEQKIPFTAFEVDNLENEYQRLNELGVLFTIAPTQTGSVSIAVFNDSCGNLIQIYQHQ